MTTLAEYAHQHFPKHAMESSDGDVTLAGHTVVAHVAGMQRGRRLEAALRDLVGGDRVSTVVVEPTAPSVMKSGGEDPEGVFDLPKRRVASGAVVGGAIVGAAVGVIAGLLIGSLAAGITLGIFAAIIGGVIGAMASGGARFAGNRAWEQRNAPDHAVVLVAVLLDDEHEANRVAAAMVTHEPDDVRILSTDGAWHSPNI